MFGIFEKPWTLTVVAVLVLFGLFQFRSIFPEKRRWQQWLIPIFLAVSAFGSDILVKTDLEKVNGVIKTGIKAVEQEDYQAIEGIIAENYSDSYHNNKASLMATCRGRLENSQVKKNKKYGLILEMSPFKATAELTVLTTFEQDSFIAKSYKPFLFIKVRLNIQKQPDKRWFINQVELLELDKQPVNWQNIR